MEQETNVGALHRVSLNIQRLSAKSTDPTFQEDKCFKLLVDSPYLNSDLYFPWSQDNPPACELLPIYANVIDEMTCRIG